MWNSNWRGLRQEKRQRQVPVPVGGAETMAASGRVGTGRGRVHCRLGCSEQHMQRGGCISEYPARTGGPASTVHVRVQYLDLYEYCTAARCSAVLAYLRTCVHARYCLSLDATDSRRRTPGQGSDRASTGPRTGGGQQRRYPELEAQVARYEYFAQRAANVPARGPRLAEAFQRCCGDAQQSPEPPSSAQPRLD